MAPLVCSAKVDKISEPPNFVVKIFAESNFMYPKDVQFPAPGYRHPHFGPLHAVGHDGYSWASMVSGTLGVFVGFYAQGLNPSSANSRAYGIQLRCLSE